MDRWPIRFNRSETLRRRSWMLIPIRRSFGRARIQPASIPDVVRQPLLLRVGKQEFIGGAERWAASMSSPARGVRGTRCRLIVRLLRGHDLGSVRNLGRSFCGKEETQANEGKDGNC